MQVSAKFLELVKIYATKQIEVNAFKAVTIAQWLLESGYGTSALFMKYNNAFGMKWRKEMLPYGEPIMYDAHDGSTEYVNFRSLDSSIDGYWAFINRSVYDGWKNSPTPEHFIRFIAQCGYCPTVGYADEVLALVPTAEKLLSEAKVAPKATTTVKLFNIGGDVGVAVYNDARAILAQRTTSTKAILDTLGVAAKDCTITMATKDDVWPGDATKPAPIPTPMPTKTKIKGKGILLNNGHPLHGRGATSTNGKVDEFDLNLFQCNRIKKALDSVGIPCTIVNQVQFGGLTETGLQAEGYDCFLALHHNATVGAQYACTMLGNNPKVGSKEFGKILSERIARVLNIKDGGFIDYVVSITKAADTTNCPIVCLVESYFIDSIPDMATAYDMSGKAADAIASALIERFV